MNEQTIQMIAQAIIANTKVLQSLVDSLSDGDATRVAQAANVAPSAPVAQPAPVMEPAPAPAPVVEPAPVVAAPQMPAPPTFEAPAAPAAAPAAPAAAPFTDAQGLMQYAMAAYQQLGADKGPQIQQVLVNLGYQNINAVAPEHYGAFFQQVEALKG